MNFLKDLVIYSSDTLQFIFIEEYADVLHCFWGFFFCDIALNM